MRVKAFGASDAIDTSATPDWLAMALELTGGHSIDDHVLELIGGDNLGQSAAALASGEAGRNSSRAARQRV